MRAVAVAAATLVVVTVGAVVVRPGPATGVAAVACPSPAPAPKVILTVGDSITAGATMTTSVTDSYRTELGRLLNEACIPHQFVVAAVGGVQCGYWTSRMAGLMTTHHPDVVLINCGTNDRSDNKTAAQLLQWEGVYRGLFDTVLDMDPDVIAYPAFVQYSSGHGTNGCTTPPGPSPEWLPASEAAANDAIFRSMVGVIDEWGKRVPTVIDYQPMDEGWLDECGVHPTPGGYALMGRIAFNAIAPKLVTPPTAPLPCGLTGRRPGHPVGQWTPCQVL